MTADSPIDQALVPPGWLGDAIVALPAVRAIASLGETLLLTHPRVFELYRLATPELEIECFDGAAHSPRGIRQSLRVRKDRPRRVVLFPRSFSSAVRGLLAGRGARIGMGGGLRGMLLTRRVAAPWPLRSRHLAEEFALLARAAGAPSPLAAPTIAIPAELAARAEARLAAAGVSAATPLVAACPGAAYGPAKRWLAERFALVLSRVAREGAATILLGGESDRAVAARVRSAASPAPHDFCGETDVGLLAALLARAEVVIANDSGPMHLAAAVGTSVVALFGSTNPDWTHPLGEGHALLRYPVPCAPCYKRHCPIGRACMEGIAVEEARAAVASRLRASPSGRGAPGGWYTPAP